MNLFQDVNIFSFSTVFLFALDELLKDIWERISGLDLVFVFSSADLSTRKTTKIGRQFFFFVGVAGLQGQVDTHDGLGRARNYSVFV